MTIQERIHAVYKNEKTVRMCSIIKCIFFLCSMTVVSMKIGGKYAFFCLCELLIMNLLSRCIKNRKAGYIISSCAYLLIGVQMMVLVFGRTYLTLVMLQNVASIQDISGNAALYITSAFVLIIVSFMPERNIENEKIGKHTLLSVCLAIELVLSMVYGNGYSPLYAYADVLQKQNEQRRIKKSVASSDATADEFHNVEIENYIEKPENLVDYPNVVVIFTEGLSQNIIADERNIMPNVAAYQKKSLNFERYYNHTFATYHGLLGQLYSGYQLNNYDTNHLVSLQDIFKTEGYSTTFINAEPNNAPFTAYLDSFNFDYLEGTTDEAKNGAAGTISDKDMYEKLFVEMEKKQQTGQPFFITMYTFGTHATLDSVDEVFDDGALAELNKFYNVDVQFGKFMDKFEESEMAENTIIVFTADHCTYLDDEFHTAFPEHERATWDCDEIPLFIYYKGIEAATIDAGGRNSLDLAPTLCDYLDMSTDNYFLGVTLFGPIENNTNYDTIFHQGDEYYTTRGGSIAGISEAEKEVLERGITRYYAVSKGN